MHHAEENGGGYVARQALDHARLEVDDHRIAETFCHEGNALVVRGDIGALAEMRENLNVGRQMLQWILGRSLCQGKEQGGKEDEAKASHREIVTLKWNPGLMESRRRLVLPTMSPGSWEDSAGWLVLALMSVNSPGENPHFWQHRPEVGHPASFQCC